MTENNKPEWFEITDADEKPALRNVSKTLPISAVIVAALLLGVGAVVAQTQEKRHDSQEVSATAVATPNTTAKSTVTNPSIAQLPTDEDEDDHQGRGHEDNDYEEGDDD